jgi:SAM-dependent methyltransferase
LWSYFTWFKEAGVGFKSSVLDVGCGNGDYLLRFASEGFTNLTGVDPFVDKDIHYPNGVVIYKKALEKMEGQFDCVFSRHSFEHMFDPIAAIKAIGALIKPGGVALIAIPVAGSAAWDEYGTDWYQIDAPRHITIPSAKAMNMLAETAGLALEKKFYDSSEEQFLASEAYKRGISLSQLQTHGFDGMFTAEQRRLFREKAEKANLAERGDQACFILRKRT